VTLLSAGLAPAAFARIMKNTIDPLAIVTDGGRQLIVTGPEACNAGERSILRVIVTQRSTGAVAEGRTRLLCTGNTPDDIQPWEVHATTQGEATFEEGLATAVALGRTTLRGETTDAHQWLVDIALVAE
jgi:hypothetical protein